jgi:hypothetical protein
MEISLIQELRAFQWATEQITRIDADMTNGPAAPGRADNAFSLQFPLFMLISFRQSIISFF